MALNRYKLHLSQSMRTSRTNEDQRCGRPRVASLLAGTCSLKCTAGLRIQVSLKWSHPLRAPANQQHLSGRRLALFPPPVTETKLGRGPEMWGGRTGALSRVWGLWPTGVLGRKPLSCNAASLEGNNSPHCWNCGGPGGPLRGDGFFCPQCRALQPPDPTRDHFSLMDWYCRRFWESTRTR